MLVSLFPRIFNPNYLQSPRRNKIEIDGCYCCFCKRENDSHKAHRYTNTSSLLHHIHLVHSKESEIEFVIEIITYLSFASQLGMVR